MSHLYFRYFLSDEVRKKPEHNCLRFFPEISLNLSDCWHKRKLCYNSRKGSASRQAGNFSRNASSFSRLSVAYSRTVRVFAAIFFRNGYRDLFALEVRDHGGPVIAEALVIGSAAIHGTYGLLRFRWPGRDKGAPCADAYFGPVGPRLSGGIVLVVDIATPYREPDVVTYDHCQIPAAVTDSKPSVASRNTLFSPAMVKVMFVLECFFSRRLDKERTVVEREPPESAMKLPAIAMWRSRASSFRMSTVAPLLRSARDEPPLYPCRRESR